MKVLQRAKEKLISASWKITGVIALIAGCLVDSAGYLFLFIWLAASAYSIGMYLHMESRDED